MPPLFVRIVCHRKIEHAYLVSNPKCGISGSFCRLILGLMCSAHLNPFSVVSVTMWLVIIGPGERAFVVCRVASLCPAFHLCQFQANNGSLTFVEITALRFLGLV